MRDRSEKQQAARKAAIISNLNHADATQIDYAFEQFQALEFLVDKLALTRDQHYDISRILSGLRPLFSEIPKSDDPH
jgi:hypothetical protein